jgi:hypothetical protein
MFGSNSRSMARHAGRCSLLAGRASQHQKHTFTNSLCWRKAVAVPVGSFFITCTFRTGTWWFWDTPCYKCRNPNHSCICTLAVLGATRALGCWAGSSVRDGDASSAALRGVVSSVWAPAGTWDISSDPSSAASTAPCMARPTVRSRESGSARPSAHPTGRSTGPGREISWAFWSALN